MGGLHEAGDYSTNKNEINVLISRQKVRSRMNQITILTRQLATSGILEDFQVVFNVWAPEPATYNYPGVDWDWEVDEIIGGEMMDESVVESTEFFYGVVLPALDREIECDSISWDVGNCTR